jgi:hypothetical protein
VRPILCPRRRRYADSPIQADDVRGARRVYRRTFGFPSNICDPSGEQPIDAEDPLCKFRFDCRKLTGRAVLDPDGDGTDNPGAVLDDIRARWEERHGRERVADALALLAAVIDAEQDVER